MRDGPRRGEIQNYPDEIGRVLLDDNEGPSNAFIWAAGGFEYEDMQFNHIYRDSKNVSLYTSLANLCLTPAFLAKLTDKDEQIKDLLRYRSYDIYGFHPTGGPKPKQPDGYKALAWMPFLAPVANLEGILRDRMESRAKSRTTCSAREIGWLYSNFEPDGSLQKMAA